MSGSGQKLKDLEKRLRDEPNNLGVRVMLAGALREAGREPEAIELYRSVAIAYRDQGRNQQAIAVCRSILELAPNDEVSLALIGQLGGRSSTPSIPSVPAPVSTYSAPSIHRTQPTQMPRTPPTTPPPARAAPTTPPATRPPPSAIERDSRTSRSDATPLPRAVPYHVADPTTANLAKLSARDVLEIPTLAEGTADPPAPSRLPPSRPGSDSGLAAAARRISRDMSRDDSYAEMDVASDLSTRKIPRIPTQAEEEKLGEIPPPTTVRFLQPEGNDVDEDAATPIPDDGNPLDTLEEEEEHTEPFDLLGARTRDHRGSFKGPSPFFAPLPDGDRQRILGRFIPRVVTRGTTVIRQGEHGHPLVIVGRGRLDVRYERPDGSHLQIGTIAAGEYVGEINLLARNAAHAHVIAATDAELLLLAPKTFYEITTEFPALWAELKDTAERRRREYESQLRRR
ncbi:MAG: cyclic nucleotide-binding domain-containing protein [Kofleriaceae bacterium]